MDINKLKLIIDGLSPEEVSDFISYIQEFLGFVNNSFNQILSDRSQYSEVLVELAIPADPDSVSKNDLLKFLENKFIESGKDISDILYIFDKFGFHFDENSKFENYLDSLIDTAGSLTSFVQMGPEQIAKNITSLQDDFKPQVQTKAPVKPVEIKVFRPEEKKAPEVSESEEGRVPAQPKARDIKLKSTTIETVLSNADIRRNFFDDQTNQENYANRLAVEMAKASGVSPATFYQPFLSIDSQGQEVELVISSMDIDEQPDGSIRILFNKESYNKICEIVSRELNLISQDVSAAISKIELASKESIENNLSAFEQSRKAIAKRLDDLIAACKKRDDYAINLVHQYKTRRFYCDPDLSKENFLSNFLTKDDKIKILLETTLNIIRPNYLFKYEDEALDIFKNMVLAKIQQSLNIQNESGWSNYAFCHFVSSGTKSSYVTLKQFEKETVSSSALVYTKCGVCGKNIYTSQKVSGKAEVEDPFKEYQEELLIPVVGSEISLPNGINLSAGTPITLDILRGSGPYPPPDGYFESKSWDEISKMVSSDNKNTNLEGLRRREFALKSLGAVSVDDGRTRYVNATKFKCPYKADSSSRVTNLVKDADCGLYLDLGPVLRGEDVSPSSLQPIARSNFDVDSETLFMSELNKSSLDDDKKKIFLDEFRKRTRGGWKFSNFHFNCPCVIEIPAAEQAEVNKILSRYSYVASPLSGPISASNISKTISDPIAGDIPAYYSPTLPDGSRWLNQDGEDLARKQGTVSYLVCGASTTLSSFSRDSSELAASLPNLIKKNFEESPDKGARFIRALISLGVDVEDIIPFLQNFNNPVEAFASLSRDRVGKIAHLLSMASKDVNLGKDDTFELLKDLQLVCQNGHKFTIKDSIYFGKTHTGFSVNRKKSPFSQDTIMRSGILTSVGIDNFNNTLKLKNSNNAQYIRPIKIEDRAAFKKQYDEWIASGRPLSDLYFSVTDEQGNVHSYSYGKVDLKNIWGSEFLSGSAPPSSTDLETRKKMTERGVTTSVSDSEKDIIGSGEEMRSYSTQEWRQEDLKSLPVLNSLSRDMFQEDASGYKIISLVASVIKDQLRMVRTWLDSSSRLDIVDYQALEDVKVYDIEREKQKNQLLTTEEFERAIKILEDSLFFLCDQDAPSPEEVSPIYQKSLSIFRRNYVSELEKINLNFAQFFGDKAIKLLSPEWIAKQLVFSLVRGSYQVDSRTGSMVKEVYDNPSEGVYFFQFNYEDIYDEVRDGVNKFVNIISDKIKFIENEKEVDRILLDPRIKQKGDVESFNRMMRINGKEYSGRILKASMAFYFAESLSRIYKTYLMGINSPNFIGHEFDINLFNISDIINISEDQIEKISISQSDFEDIDDFYENYLEEVTACLSELEKSTILSKTACYSSLYTEKALEYIKNQLSSILTSDQLDQQQKERAKLIINNVMVVTPFDTIDLNSNGKHRKFFGGKDSIEPISLIPNFSAILAEHVSGSYPIYVLMAGGSKMHSFDFGKDENGREFRISPAQEGRLKILTLINPSSLGSYYQVNDVEVKQVEKVYPGWNIIEVSVTSNKNSKEYTGGNYFYLDATKISSNTGLKEGVSIYYHPGSVVVKEEKKEIGVINNQLNFDSTDSLSVGQLSARTGSSRLVPPLPLIEDPVQMAGISNAGVPIPLKYSGEDFVSSKDIFPILDIKVPVIINSNLEIDISDLLLRYPTSAAFSYLRNINSLYNEMCKKIEMGASEDSQIIDNYKEQIKLIWQSYRALPFFVANKQTGSKRERLIFGKQDVIKPRRSPYIPFLDWVTSYKIISQEVCGPSYGGHSLWGTDFSQEDIAEIKDGIENFLIDINRLDVLAKSLEKAIYENEGKKVTIDPKDMLDPIQRLFSGNLTPEQVYKYFGYSFSTDKDFTSQDNFAWGNTPSDKDERENIQNVAIGKVVKHFGEWLSAPGKFYSIGKYDHLSGENIPYARIVTGNRVFPKTLDQRQALLKAKKQSSDAQILSPDDLFSSQFYYGSGADEEYYPIPQDPEHYKEYLNRLKKVRHIGTKTFAESMSKYAQDSVIYRIREFLASEFLKSGGRKEIFIKLAKSLDKR
jgi:hypothetical protein